MTEAIIGLVGVALGAFASFGASYIMERRRERVQARASARLLQSELEVIAQQLHAFTLMHETPDQPEFMRRRAEELLRTPGLREHSLDNWREHQGRLAETLSTSDWDAVSRAYAAIETGQRLERLRAGDEAGVQHDLSALHDVHYWVRNGAVALSRLAGKELTERDLDQMTLASALALTPAGASSSSRPDGRDSKTERATD